MKITKRQLRRIIREEYEQLPQAGDPAEFARLKAQRDSVRIPSSTSMGQTARTDELFDARDNLLGILETMNPDEAGAYIQDLIEELQMMQEQM